MNYTSRFGLEFNPFHKNSKEILVSTSNWQESKIRLDYLLQTKGFGLITGEPGCGKTTIIRNRTNTLNKTAYKVIYLPLSTLSVQESYKQLALALNIEPHYRKHKNFEEIQSAIRRLSIEKKITPIIISDEANYISNAFLNDLKMLFNFDMDSKDLAVVLLVGQSVLTTTLSLKTNEALKQRIITSYNVETLSIEESIKYIQSKLSAAGCNAQIFSEQALRAISSNASGNPRIISRICDLSLMIADKMSKSIIDEEIAFMANEEVRI